MSLWTGGIPGVGPERPVGQDLRPSVQQNALATGVRRAEPLSPPGTAGHTPVEERYQAGTPPASRVPARPTRLGRKRHGIGGLASRHRKGPEFEFEDERDCKGRAGLSRRAVMKRISIGTWAYSI